MKPLCIWKQILCGCKCTLVIASTNSGVKISCCWDDSSVLSNPPYLSMFLGREARELAFLLIDRWDRKSTCLSMMGNNHGCYGYHPIFIRQMPMHSLFNLTGTLPFIFVPLLTYRVCRKRWIGWAFGILLKSQDEQIEKIACFCYKNTFQWKCWNLKARKSWIFEIMQVLVGRFLKFCSCENMFGWKLEDKNY